MFVVSSIPEKYVGEVVVSEGHLRKMHRVGETLVNNPVNINLVKIVETGKQKWEGLDQYFITFVFNNKYDAGEHYSWHYLEESTRDKDFQRIIGGRT